MARSTKWNDAAIKSQNPKLNLPDTDITVVHRSDKSGTTQNFVSYFKDAAPNDWTYDLSENWPNEVGQGAKGTSGVISTVKQADGTIGYADFSQVGELGTVAVKVGSKYTEISADAGSKVIEDSELADVKGEHRVVVNINHKTEADGAYLDRAGLLRHRLPGVQGHQDRRVRQVLAELRHQRRRPEDRPAGRRHRAAAEHADLQDRRLHQSDLHQVSRSSQPAVPSEVGAPGPHVGWEESDSAHCAE